MDIDDTIAVLCPETNQARMVPRMQYNRDRCIQSNPQLTALKRKRGNTSALSGLSNAQIILTFSVKPFDPLEGFVFGSDDENATSYFMSVEDKMVLVVGIFGSNSSGKRGVYS